MSGGATGPVGQARQAAKKDPAAAGFARPPRGWSSAPVRFAAGIGRSRTLQSTARGFGELRRSPGRSDTLGGTEAPADVAAALRRQPAGRPLPAEVTRRFGACFGGDLSGVRIHTGGHADRLARSVQSAAFTHGSDVYFTAGAFAPHTERGQRLLAHELAHVAQNHGPSSVHRFATVIGRANDPCERDADLAAEGVMTALRRSPPQPANEPTLSQQRVTGPAAADDHTLRRKFGFEYELKIPVFSRDISGNPAPPKPKPGSGVHLAAGDGFEVHVDHSSSLNMAVPPTARVPASRGSKPMASILEVATTALDESTVSANDVRSHIKKSAIFAKKAQLRAKRHTANRGDWARDLFHPTTLLDNQPNITLATPANTNYIGPAFASASIPDAVKVGLITRDAYTQGTYGISLKTLPKHFESEAGSQSTITARHKTALTRAVAIGAAVTESVLSSRFTRYRDEGARRELTGYFTAISYYLLAAGTVTRGEAGALGKNMIGPYFFKTGLNTVGTQLKTKYSDARNALSRWNRSSVAKKLLAQTGRKGSDGFFPGSRDFTCRAWLEGVLSGRDDLAFETWKNPWSSELTAPSIGQGSEQGVGLVIESRRLADTFGRAGKRYTPDEWPDVAVRVYYQLLLLSGTDKQRKRAKVKLGLGAPTVAVAPSTVGGDDSGIPAPPPPPTLTRM